MAKNVGREDKEKRAIALLGSTVSVNPFVFDTFRWSGSPLSGLYVMGVRVENEINLQVFRDGFWHPVIFR